MYYKVKTRKQGGSVAITLPADVARKLAVKESTVLYMVEQKPGEYVLTPFDPEFAEAMQVYQRGAERYKNALRELAK
ncbi:MAG: hypothetical protein A2W29_00070 [Gemmatimonadetes bacterium RBG_16_66_8]|nr:MAG: hypothetical protein A2W29_00070 [Gemmatimonadetes bacterium RBG_16_66_8]